MTLAGARFVILGPTEPPVGGVSRYCSRLVSLLREEGAAVATVDVDRATESRAGLGGLEKLVLRYAGPRTLATCLETRRGPDRIVIDNFQHFWRRTRHSLCVTLLHRSPYVLVLHHGGIPDVLRGLDRLHRRALSMFLERISGVICMGEPVAQAVAQLAPRARMCALTPAFPASDVADLPGSLEPETLPFERYLCFGGSLGAIYGLGDMLEGYRVVAREDADLGLVLLLGSSLREPSELDRLERFVEGPLGSRVRMLVDHPRGSAVIAGSAAYVRCTRADAFPLGLHEARLAGVPFVVSRIAGRPPGAREYEVGDPQALAVAIRSALTPSAAAEARRQRSVAKEEALLNAERTVAFLRDVA